MMQSEATAEAVGSPGYGTFQLSALVALRMIIGWHIFYEGLAKVLSSYWTSADYLSASQWWFSSLFVKIAASPTPLGIVDFLNKWGLIAIGLGLMLGCLTRAATIAGIVLLALYYIAAPPFAGYTYSMPAEGSYLLVNKILIELAALVVLLAFPTGRIIGLDRLIFWNRGSQEALTLAEDVR